MNDKSNSPQADTRSSIDSGRELVVDAPLRIALAGAGRMARHHAHAIRRLGGLAELIGICDPSANAVDSVRAIWPNAVGVSTLDELLQRTDVDVVHVCTPPETHERLAAAALEAGCHVYVEKPFTLASHEAERLIGIAEDRELKLCAGHQLLFEAPARKALELLPALGSVAHLESYFSFRTVRRSPDGRAPLSSDLQLLDILPHPVYLLLQFLETAVPGAKTELRGVELGTAGTLHGLVRRGELTGTLVVTLEGRPVESYLRAVGTNGSLHADFVRGTVQRLIGPGSSGIDKLINPYSVSRQLLTGTTTALGRRFMKRQRSYPGLAELFEAFYDALRAGRPSPVSSETILETVRVCEQIRQALSAPRSNVTTDAVRPIERAVLVTGGTGFLGAEVVRTVAGCGTPVRAVARREPASWERVPGVDYAVTDLALSVPSGLFSGVDTVVHCAAATAGGWEEHRVHSIGATENLIRAAAAAGVRRIVHVSSLAVVDESKKGALNEDTPLESAPQSRGPYVWGKLESEKAAVRIGSELGIAVKVVRPGPIVDYRNFEPPGRLGKRVGNVFVAVGSPREPLPVVGLGEAARLLAWMAEDFEAAPDVLNLLTPKLPTRRDLVEELRRSNPDLRVVWLSQLILRPASLAAVGLQKVARRGRPAINVSRVFASRPYDTKRAAEVFQRVGS